MAKWRSGEAFSGAPFLSLSLVLRFISPSIIFCFLLYFGFGVDFVGACVKGGIVCVNGCVCVCLCEFLCVGVCVSVCVFVCLSVCVLSVWV